MPDPLFRPTSGWHCGFVPEQEAVRYEQHADRSKYRRHVLSGGRLALLAERNFLVFYASYIVSLLGSAMAGIALTFAVLGDGGSAADLGYVFAAAVVPEAIFMLGGGVLADRLGRRAVMLSTDSARVVVQAILAAALFAGRTPIWLIAVLAGLAGSGSAFFTPALGGLTPQIAPAGRLADANALLSVARSATTIAGPALAGVLVAVSSPATVIAADAGSFAVSVVGLTLLRVPRIPRPDARSPWRDLAEGWGQFLAHTWLWVTTAQFALFNLFTWAPYLLIGPILARDYLGGARAWGLIVTAGAAGAIVAGAFAVGRRPRRPLVVAVVASFGYPAPCLALALHAAGYVVAAGAVVAGAASAITSTYHSTVLQQQVAPGMLARATAFSLTGSYTLGAAGYAVIGPISGLVGAGRLLAFAAAYATLSSAVVMTVPAVRRVRWQDRLAHPDPDLTGQP
jgi:MFS family permease